VKTNQKKKLLLVVGVIVALFAIKAYACYTQTFIVDGRIINCTTCGNVTNCF
jgi:hypothetical protein